FFFFFFFFFFSSRLSPPLMQPNASNAIFLMSFVAQIRVTYNYREDPASLPSPSPVSRITTRSSRALLPCNQLVGTPRIPGANKGGGGHALKTWGN
ncbi:uncharacterized protein F4812DRAFT_424375, partial [Daldinia caldariorum]|uniref:uncharacterized protein n=1 Tax=Daldinia caldariorum TaxID=326644 RepID=UPI00200813C1